MNVEIERKFLLPEFPFRELERGEITMVAKHSLFQTYLAYSDDQEIRVRQSIDDQGVSHYTHTFKSGHGLVRQEIEYEISEKIYRQLLSHTGLVPLEKIRITVEGQGVLFQIDEYKELDLRVVEVEFPDETAAKSFSIPHWFGRELGQEEEFRNKMLWIKLQTITLTE
ncbi:CYTH domain-containing protein [Paenibacillus sp. GCM10027628]|uniref:CYTH domain-containing protein n=1 Tax=Paenibacillus sp. GCM10027628 TaxID=3273413 RepID=UPI00363C30E1